MRLHDIDGNKFLCPYSCDYEPAYMWSDPDQNCLLRKANKLEAWRDPWACCDCPLEDWKAQEVCTNCKYENQGEKPSRCKHPDMRPVKCEEICVCGLFEPKDYQQFTTARENIIKYIRQTHRYINDKESK